MGQSSYGSESSEGAQDGWCLRGSCRMTSRRKTMKSALLAKRYMGHRDGNGPEAGGGRMACPDPLSFYWNFPIDFAGKKRNRYGKRKKRKREEKKRSSF